MGNMPKPINHTVDRLYEAMAKAGQWGDAPALSFDDALNACDRAIWNKFRWIAPAEEKTGKQQSVINTAIAWKERLIFDLRSALIDVEDDGAPIAFADGHVRGKLHGIATGIPEAPVARHVILCKALKDKDFKALVKGGLLKAKPAHWDVCQMAMKAVGVSRALYLAVNKNDDERYSERVHLDDVRTFRMEGNALGAIYSERAPARNETFACEWCKSRAQCLEGAWSRVHCRTCMHSTPSAGGAWQCEKHAMALTLDDQKAGCPDHRYIPDLVPGEQVNVVENDIIVYRLPDGSEWFDGFKNNEVTDVVEEDETVRDTAYVQGFEAGMNAGLGANSDDRNPYFSDKSLAETWSFAYRQGYSSAMEGVK